MTQGLLSARDLSVLGGAGLRWSTSRSARWCWSAMMVYYHVAPSARIAVPAGGRSRCTSIFTAGVGAAAGDGQSVLSRRQVPVRGRRSPSGCSRPRCSTRSSGSADGSACCSALNPMTPIIDAYRVGAAARARCPSRPVRGAAHAVGRAPGGRAGSRFTGPNLRLRRASNGDRQRSSFEHVWKKFRRGERHDSLRDLVPSLVAALPAGTPARASGDAGVLGGAGCVVRGRAGEALGIIGPNGAGKSTTLKLLTPDPAADPRPLRAAGPRRRAHRGRGRRSIRI